MSEHLDDVSHEYIRYANCWEDANVLLKGLNIGPKDRVLSIGSAGDNSFSMLVDDPQLVVAVDINPVQLHLIKLKKAAIKAFDQDTFLQFLGFKDAVNRRDLFEIVSNFLETDDKVFWEARFSDIEQGLIHQGKFEKYFLTFSSKILPLIHSKKSIQALFKNKSIEDQKEFYTERWNNKRWKMLFKVFFSKLIMGKFGRDPEFLKHVDIPVSDFIFDQAERHLTSDLCQNNYFLHYIMRGKFEQVLPHYVKRGNYDLIKSRIDRLSVFNGLANDAFQRYEQFNKFNLSDIFEYMNQDLFKTVVDEIVDKSDMGSRFLYWNLMVPRKMSDVHMNLSYESEMSIQLKEEDMGFFYRNVHLDVKT